MRGIKLANFDLEAFLREYCPQGISDVHLNLGKPPALRMLNNIFRTELEPLDEEDFDEILKTILYKDQWEKIRNLHNFDFTYEIKDLSRFRVNYCMELGKPKLTLRLIPYEIPSLAKLALPDSLKNFVHEISGIVLVTGPTGTGKSTTLASLLEMINQQQTKHIITIEDPVEFIYTDKKSIITQRQLGIDVDTFPDGIKYALRQDPDVILVGEIRDRETVEAALSASETGHLVFATVHTNSAIQTINRIINLFDEGSKEFTRERLANCLRGSIAQRLLHKIEGGRVPAVEVLMMTPAVKDYILKNELEKIYPLLQQGGISGMTTMNESIYGLLKTGIVTEEDAINASDNQVELRQMIKGYYQGVKHRAKEILDI
jgi:twitching motility protein PilT